MIIQGNKGSVDLESPIEATELQKDRFINFFKANYNAVKIVEVRSFRSIRLNPNRMFLRKFIDEEIPFLLNLDNPVGKVAESLGRPIMTVAKKRGELLPTFINWTIKANRNMVTEDMDKLIADFIEYQKKYREEKKQIRKEGKNKDKRIKELQERIEFWKSSKKREELETFARFGKIEGNVDDLINKKIIEFQEEIGKINLNLKKSEL